MKILKMALTAVAVMALGTSAFADEAYDIVKKSTTLPVPATSETDMILSNIEKNGTVEVRMMKQVGREVDGLVSTVFEFKSPASVKDTRVLQSEKKGREDDRWIYMPSLRQVRRIPMGERYKQFVGCEFTYNDMGIRDVDDDTHEMLEQEVKVSIPGGKSYTCWKIKSVPKKKGDVEYSYRIQYIDKETYLPAKFEYFDKKDQTKLMKTYTTEDWMYYKAKKSGKTYNLRTKARIVNNITGRQTLLEIKPPKFDEGVSPAYFTQQFLSTGKAK